MRALCLTAAGGPRQLAVVELPRPTLRAADEVRVGIRAAGLNHLDLAVAEGLPGLPPITYPFVVGTDGAGVVLEVGAAVQHLRVGDRVVVNPGISCGECEPCRRGQEVFCRGFGVLGEHRPGLAAEEVVLPGRNVLAIAGDWEWPEAAAFPLATLTAWRMLTTRARLEAGECVLIWGVGGGVALAALQVVRHLGARAIVTSASPAKLIRAADFGAELGLDSAAEDLPAQVKACWGHGADVVVDSVGSATWARSLKALRPGGRLVTCGATAGPEVALDLRRLFWFQWSLLGSTMGTSREFAEVVALGNAGALRPPVDAVYPLAQGVEGYQRLARAEQFGKLVLEVSS